MKLKESDLKRTAVDYLNLKGVFNYPLLQGIGSYKGLPDRVMHRNGHVEYIEFKTPEGKLSIYQQIFQGQCHVDGIPYLVIHSIDELISLFE